MDELKPCPFCGGKAKLNSINQSNPFWVSCTSCGASAGPDNGFHCVYEAVDAWNHRTAPENKPLTLEQVRQMDGEPVWCEIPQDNPQYGIVKTALESVWLPVGILQFKYFGEWKAYAHKPEGAEQHERPN